MQEMQKETELSLRDQLRQEFIRLHGWGDATVRLVAGDASFRKYYRLGREVEVAILPETLRPEGIPSFVGKERDSVILMDAPPPEEDVRPFVKVAHFLHFYELRAPQIIAKDEENGFLLLEDFGDDRFSRTLMADGPQTERRLYRLAIDTLISLQRCDISNITVPDYSIELLLKEVLLLVDWYYPLIHGDVLPSHERNDFISLWSKILPHVSVKSDNSASEMSSVLVLRDYHADNLMWLGKGNCEGEEQVGLLDFQDAVKGHPAYDVVSLLEDARRDVSPELMHEMIEYYTQSMSSEGKIRFLNVYALLGAQRNSKILGIFARLAVRDGKVNYLKFMPRVWRYLEQDLQHPTLQPIALWLEEKFDIKTRGVMPKL